jgi:hypothetical protein
MKNMHGYQIRTLIEKMYLIQRLIVEQNWDELKKKSLMFSQHVIFPGY